MSTTKKNHPPYLNKLLDDLRQVRASHKTINIAESFTAWEVAAKAMRDAVIECVKTGKTVVFLGKKFSQQFIIKTDQIGLENVDWLRYIDEKNLWQSFRMSAADKIEVL